MQKTISVSTKTEKEIVDITKEIETFVKLVDIKEGLVTVFSKHTTCAIILTELSEDLDHDILKVLSYASYLGPFSHNEGNPGHAPSHIIASLIGQSRSIPIVSGKLDLGTWQHICLLELNGPKKREIVLQTSA